jgi:hypothetical protein
MNVNLPPAPPNQPFLGALIGALQRAFLSIVSKDTAVSHILLLSPNKSVYTISVSDTGVVQATLNSGKTRDI